MDKTTIEKELKLVITSELKRIREQTGCTLEQMASEVGIEYNNLFNIYSGRNLPRVATLFMISQAYGIPPEFWFRELQKLTDKKKTELQNKANEATILKNFSKLDSNMREAVFKLIKSYNNRKPLRKRQKAS